MKRLIMFLFLLGILNFTRLSLAATIGGPEMDIPEGSFSAKKYAVNRSLNRWEFDVNIKSSFEAEFITKKKLKTSSEATGAEIEGQNYMVKVSNNFNNIFEPYIKIGTSDLEVKWTQNGNSVRVEASPSFIWGAGIKAKIYEFEDYGIKLTLDTQYRNLDLDVDKIDLAGTSSGLQDEKIEIEEWETSLLASKKFIVPIGLKDYYMAPYTGITFSVTDVDVSFKQTSTGLDYSVYKASDDSVFGFVLGCDIMPSLLSWYLFNFEIRLVNETAFTLGGTMRF
ncbi:hypothetical protein ACFL0P_06455 [Candidatus Omnitrophota bacterium]